MAEGQWKIDPYWVKKLTKKSFSWIVIFFLACWLYDNNYLLILPECDDTESKQYVELIDICQIWNTIVSQLRPTFHVTKPLFVPESRSKEVNLWGAVPRFFETQFNHHYLWSYHTIHEMVCLWEHEILFDVRPHYVNNALLPSLGHIS
jgi:hypothetical protein